MSEYETKVAEAAAAWEADKKKKKGKAKDEASLCLFDSIMSTNRRHVSVACVQGQRVPKGVYV